MPVRVDLRIVAKQNEQIGVSPVGKVHLDMISDILMTRRKPRLNPLPRGIRAIELVSPVGPIAICQQQARLSDPRLRGTQRAKRQVPIISIRRKARRAISRESELLGIARIA